MMIRDYGTVTDKRIALSVITGVLVAYVLYGAWYHGRTWLTLNVPGWRPVSIEERIKRGCEREFGGQGVLVDRCKIQLMSEELLKHQQNLLDRARR